MKSIKHNSDVRCLVEQDLKVFDGLLFGKVESKLFLQLFMYIAVFDVRDVCIHHQGHQVENQICALSQNSERREAEVLETSVVR